MKPMQRVVALSSALLLTACNLAPDFYVPKTETPAAFKEAITADGKPVEDGAWQRVDEASFKAFGKDAWWKLFADPRLDALVASGMEHSPTLDAARERLKQARALTDAAESNLWPEIAGGVGVNRQKQSTANPNIPPGTGAKPYTLYRAQVGVDYGLDIFGRARSNLEAAFQRAEAERALYHATRLTLQADIAQQYFALLSLGEEEAMLKRSLVLRNETLKLTRTRYEIGEVSDLDVSRAEVELATTESDRLAVSEQRAVAEHALAILTGKPPASFAMPACELKQGSASSCGLLSPPPAIPAGLPSSLLERRPDIAAAARELAARNAEIGFARAAFFPSIDLTANFGYESSSLGSLFDWSSRTWLLGPISGTFATLPIFTGGRNSANLALAKASWREQVANYRGAVLSAFKDVEDALVAVRTARERTISQGKALAAGNRAYTIARLQYDNGYTDYLTLIDAERSLIASARGEVQSRGQQYIATVTLIRALGGGWGEVSKEKRLMPTSEVEPKDVNKPKARKAKPITEPAPVAMPPATLPDTPELIGEPLKAAPEAKAEPLPKPAPKRLPRPWDEKAAGAPAAPIAPEAAPAATKPPAAIPFRVRNPKKPVPGLETAPAVTPAPITQPTQDLDTENAPENTVLPFKRQGDR